MKLEAAVELELVVNCSLRADKAVDAFQLIVVESQRSQVELELAVELEAAVELELVVELFFES